MSFYPEIIQDDVTLKCTASSAVLYIKRLNNTKITLNETAKLIFDYCNGLYSIEDIVLVVRNVYGDEVSLEEDITKTIKTFNKYGIINWRNNKNPFARRIIVNDSIIERLDLSSLDTIYYEFDECIRDGIFEKNNVLIEKTKLFQTIFFGIHKIYYIKKYDKPAALIIFQRTETISVWQLIELKYNKNIKLLEFKEIFTVLINDLTNNNENVKSAIVINSNDENLHLLLDIGFNVEGTLINEIDDEVYSLWMQ